MVQHQMLTLWTALWLICFSIASVATAGSDQPSSSDLGSFQEPELASDGSKEQAETYRFIWRRSFHAPISVRAFQVNGTAKLRVVRLDGKGGYDFGQIDVDKTINLQQGQFEELRRLAARSTVPESVELLGSSFMDGSDWSLEVRNDTGYRFQEITCPLAVADEEFSKALALDEATLEQLDGFLAICKKLLEYAKLAEADLYEKDAFY